MDLPDGSALILSIAKYYAPDGKSIQDNAVTPNVMVADNNDDAGAPDDEVEAPPAQEEGKKAKPPTDDQLQRAIQVLKARENKG
jgi:carboxyl-terminal processing protease